MGSRSNFKFEIIVGAFLNYREINHYFSIQSKILLSAEYKKSIFLALLNEGERIRISGLRVILKIYKSQHLTEVLYNNKKNSNQNCLHWFSQSFQFMLF